MCQSTAEGALLASVRNWGGLSPTAFGMARQRLDGSDWVDSRRSFRFDRIGGDNFYRKKQDGDVGVPDLDHAFYRDRAAAARKLAENATDPEVKAIHERMAADYSTLAELKTPPKLRIVIDK